MKTNKSWIILLLLVIVLIFTSTCKSTKDDKKSAGKEEIQQEESKSQNPDQLEQLPLNPENETPPNSETENLPNQNKGNEETDDNSKENNNEENTPEKEEEPNNDFTKLSDEQIYLGFKELINSNSAFVLTRQVGGQTNYLLKCYYDGEKIYTITTTTTTTHKVYTNELVYTNNLANKVNATKSIDKLKSEFIGEVFDTTWSFSEKIIGENKNFNQCEMIIKGDKEIEFTFKMVEGANISYFVVCNLEIKENLNLKEVLPNALKSVG